MRLYLKLLLLIVVFVCAARRPLWRALSDVAYDIRVTYVFAFGNAADMDQLLDDTQRHLAEQEGNLVTYLRGRRFRELLEQRLADARARGLHLDDDQVTLIREACQAEAFGPTSEPAPSTPEKLPNIGADDW